MSRASAYVICGTPRSGSTLLCEMLWASGVAGRPNSYFREQDSAHWATVWNIDVSDDRAFLDAMRTHGRDGTNMFGLRLMWGSLAHATQRLQRGLEHIADLPTLCQMAFGPTRFIHLSRADTLAQAISLVRAEQSGLWHLNADGSVLEGRAAAPVHYDGARIGTVLDEIKADNAHWTAFFADHDLVPLRLDYETLAADPQAALAFVLTALGFHADIAATVPTRTARMADGISEDWKARYRAETAATGLPR